jgi:phosphoglycolate phosphatase-like HAD superfamily hydrolase
MPVRAVLLDLDGTLVDSFDHILSAFEAVLESRGVPAPEPARLASLASRALDDCYRALVPELECHELVEAHRCWQRERPDPPGAFPGAGLALERLRDSSIRRAVVTSRSREGAARVLEQTGLGSQLDVLVCCDDAAAPKPDASAFLLALARLGEQPSGAAVVGDGAVDIEAGRALGCLTVACTYGFQPAAALAAGPDLTIASIAELPSALGVRQRLA